MNEQELNETLLKIGKEVFVHFYGEFADLSLPNSAIVPSVVEYVSLKNKNPASYNAANTRVSKARRIIKSGNGRVALLNCSQSDIPEALQRKATRLAGKG